MARFAFLVSGGGGTLRCLTVAIERLGLPFEIAAVVADRECGAVEFARGRGLPTEVVEYSPAAPTALRDALDSASVDCVITNIHKIIDAETLQRSSAVFVNLHYSLLPAFAGLIGMATLDAARAIGARFVGGTCHEVVEEVDAGPILCQGSVPVDWSNDEDLQDVVFRLSSLSLLNALLYKFDTPETSDATHFGEELFGRRVVFSPPLDDRLRGLNEEFWREVRGEF